MATQIIWTVAAKHPEADSSAGRPALYNDSLLHRELPERSSPELSGGLAWTYGNPPGALPSAAKAMEWADDSVEDPYNRDTPYR